MYKCNHCKNRYTPSPKERKYSKEVKRQAIKLYMEGNSGRAVGRILGISKNTCLYWIKKYTKEIELENAANEREKVIEMDELRHYIPPLHRKSKCSFRSLDTAKSVFKIFVNAFNNFALHKFLHLSLKSAFSLSSFI